MLAAIVVAGGILFTTRRPHSHPDTAPNEKPPQSASLTSPASQLAAEDPRPQAVPQNPTLSDIALRIARAGDLTKARQAVASEVKRDVESGRINVVDLQAAILDTSQPTKARIIFAEAIIGLLANEASALDVPALSLALDAAQSPLLAARIIDLLGLTKNTKALEAIEAKCLLKAENVRLAGVSAASKIESPEAADFLLDCTRDPDFYRVRIQAIHRISHHPSTTNRTSAIIEAVLTERERSEEATPSGQSPDLNRQLMAIAATKALTNSSDPSAVAFLMNEMLNSENVDLVRMAAADALAHHTDPSVATGLLRALNDSDEGVRLHAAGSLSQAFGNQFTNEIAAAREASSDPYVIKQLSELLESTK